MSKSDSKNKSSTNAGTNTGSKAEIESRAYQSMLGELDEIVRAVGQGQLDLDDVVGKIEHGYKLIATMRERLDATKARVEKLRVDFEGSDSNSKSLTSKAKKSTAANMEPNTEPNTEPDRETATETGAENDDLPF
jgi:exodeoxyribonuclease VII small subunit